MTEYGAVCGGAGYFALPTMLRVSHTLFFKEMIMNKLEIVFKFTILHEGWEMDNTGWIKKNPSTGEYEFWETNHGTEQKSTANELQDYIDTMESVLVGLFKARKFLK